LFFTDLQGFTGLAEHSQPSELVAFLNAYFTRMCQPVLAEHGVIDKFIGDAIMAFFGAPIATTDHGSAGRSRSAVGSGSQRADRVRGRSSRPSADQDTHRHPHGHGDRRQHGLGRTLRLHGDR
jgi:adenylate cyclase